METQKIENEKGIAGQNEMKMYIPYTAGEKYYVFYDGDVYTSADELDFKYLTDDSTQYPDAIGMGMTFEKYETLNYGVTRDMTYQEFKEEDVRMFRELGYELTKRKFLNLTSKHNIITSMPINVLKTYGYVFSNATLRGDKMNFVFAKEVD